MDLRYLLKMLALPPGCLLLMLLVAWMFRRRLPRLASLLFLGSVAALWMLSTPWFVEWAGHRLETDAPLPASAWPVLADRADAIVVLGAGRRESDPGWGKDVAGIYSTERVRYGARIAKASRLPVLVSGGKVWEDDSHPSEADLMAEVFEKDHQQPVQWREGHSRTTQENAERSWAMLEAQGKTRIVLVTQAWHMPRARRLFLQQGFTVIPAPMGYLSAPNGRPFQGVLPDANSFSNSVLIVHEGLGAWLYAHAPAFASSR
jgi:uncharacterized SAM-binding protein YcdF (DUF218 family)